MAAADNLGPQFSAAAEAKNLEPNRKRDFAIATGHKAPGAGPNYNPTDFKTFEYNEGYEHGRNAQPYKGYGGRPKAIAYGTGYKHGQADASPRKPAGRGRK